MAGGDFKTTLTYLDWTEGEEKPYVYNYKRTDGGPQYYSKNHKKEMTIFDVRPEQDTITLDGNGICVVPHETSLSTEDFYESPEKIQKVFYQECIDLIKRSTGASKVIVFDHNVRSSDALKNAMNEKGRREISAEKTGGSVISTPAIGGCHNDYTEWSGVARLKDLAKPPGDPNRMDYKLTGGKAMVDEKELPELLKNRFVYINVWKNISEIPVMKHPLAVCDGASCDPKSFVEMGNIYIDRYGEIYSFRHDDSHRWIYYSQLRKDEAILLKCYDSRTDVARWTGHCSVDDPLTSKDMPPRESIEARCIAFFSPGDPEYTAKGGKELYDLAQPPGSLKARL